MMLNGNANQKKVETGAVPGGSMPQMVAMRADGQTPNLYQHGSPLMRPIRVGLCVSPFRAQVMSTTQED